MSISALSFLGEIKVPLEAAVIYSVVFFVYLLIWFSVIVTGLIRWGHKNNLLAIAEKDKGKKKKRIRLWLTVILLLMLLGMVFMLEGIKA